MPRLSLSLLGPFQVCLADFMQRRGQYIGIVPVAQAAIELAQKSHDMLEQARGIIIWGTALWNLLWILWGKLKIAKKWMD